MLLAAGPVVQPEEDREAQERGSERRGSVVLLEAGVVEAMDDHAARQRRKQDGDPLVELLEVVNARLALPDEDRHRRAPDRMKRHARDEPDDVDPAARDAVVEMVAVGDSFADPEPDAGG